jgi:hypothetical protein
MERGVSLSDHEQRVLDELEQALMREDPALAGRVSSENVHRYAVRHLKWSALGFIAGLAVTLAFFATSVALGFVGVVIMMFSMEALSLDLDRMIRGARDDLGQPMRIEGLGFTLNEIYRWLYKRLGGSG